MTGVQTCALPILSADIRDDLEIMNLNTTRLLDLVNQLLDFRKTETRGFQLNFVECNISDILQQIYMLRGTERSV